MCQYIDIKCFYGCQCVLDKCRHIFTMYLIYVKVNTLYVWQMSNTFIKYSIHVNVFILVFDTCQYILIKYSIHVNIYLVNVG